MKELKDLTMEELFRKLIEEQKKSNEVLQDIRSILEPEKFIPEDSDGKHFSTKKCANP